MKKRTQRKFHFTYFFVAFFISFAQLTAYADIECSTTNSLGVNGLACLNTNSVSQTVVTFREMPGWNGNASLVMVDMCQVPEGSIALDNTNGSEALVSNISQAELTELKPTQCLRRICTQDLKSFSFRVSGIPIIPITTAFGLGISFGFSKSSFEVSCTLLGDQK